MNSNKEYLQLLFWTSLFTVILGLVVLYGWVFDIPVFKTILPGYVSMKLNTVLFFLSTATVLLLFAKNKLHFLERYLALGLTIFAMASLYQDVFDLSIGIDEFFIPDVDAAAKGDNAPGRPSPSTSFCFMLFGFVLVTLRNRKRKIRVAAQIALHIITLIAFIAIEGYLFNVPKFYKLSIFTSMAIHTSTTLFMLSLAVSFMNPKHGITDIFVGKRIGNFVARNLFLKLVVAILILTFLKIVAARSGLVSGEFGIALLSTSFILVTLFSLRFTVKHLNRIDIKREKAEKALLSTNKNLETKVAERTKHLTRQNRQLEDFAYIVSHNLRGPTGNLKTLLHFHSTEKDKKEKELIMDKFQITVNNLEGTLNDLLEVISIRGGAKNEKEKVCFKCVLTKLIESFQGKIMETNATISFDFSAADSILYSRIYLESIMQNLLSNAIKYRSLERNPQIHFETGKHNGETTLEIRDNGLGIDMKANGKSLFGLHKTFHKHPDAKGVGLFITKAQVEAMGGEITADSELTKGTTFKVKF